MVYPEIWQDVPDQKVLKSIDVADERENEGGDRKSKIGE